MENDKKMDMQGLIEKGKSSGSLSNSDILEAVEYSGFDMGQIDKVYEVLENSGIEVTNNYMDDSDDEYGDMDRSAEVDDNEDIDKFLAEEGDLRAAKIVFAVGGFVDKHIFPHYLTFSA